MGTNLLIFLGAQAALVMLGIREAFAQPEVALLWTFCGHARPPEPRVSLAIQPMQPKFIWDSPVGNMPRMAKFSNGNIRTMNIHARWIKILKDIWNNKSRSMLVIASIAVGTASVGMITNAAHIIQRNERDTSNWKWVGRWERMQR